MPRRRGFFLATRCAWAISRATVFSRRAALTHLAARLPAAVLADLLNLAPATAVKWVGDAGGDWTRYAAQIAQDSSHQP